MAESEVRLGDLSLTPEQKAGFEKAISGIERAVLDNINPKLMTVEAVNGLIQTALRSQLDAMRPSATRQEEADKMAVREAWVRSILAFNPEVANKARAELASDRFAPYVKTTIASVVSGTSTYTNTTPTLVVNDILQYASLLFWHRRESRVVPTTAISGVYPVGGSTRVTAYRRTQGDDHTASSPTMGGHAFTKLPLSDSVIVSKELLEWGIPVLYQFFVEEIGYGIGYKEFTEFQTGTDSSQWNGHENAGYTQVTGGTSDEMDTIKKLYYTLPEMFRPRATFWASGNTISAITQLKNPAGYPYFPQPGALETLCGKRLLECGVATDGLLFFGDLNRYHIYDGNIVTGTTDEGKNLASSNSFMLYFHTTNDAGPADTNAFRYASITVV